MNQNHEMNTRAVIALAMQVGLSTAIASTSCILGGLWLDRHFHLSPIFTILGVIAGLVASLGLVWQIVKKSKK